jgi:hypothetical protein
MIPRLIYKIEIDEAKAEKTGLNIDDVRRFIDKALVEKLGFSRDGDTYSLLSTQDKGEVVGVIMKSSGVFFDNERLLSCLGVWLAYNNIESEDSSYYLVEDCIEASRQIKEGHAPVNTTYLEKISDEKKSA